MSDSLATARAFLEKCDEQIKDRENVGRGPLLWALYHLADAVEALEEYDPRVASEAERKASVFTRADDWHPLAWEIARSAHIEATDGGGVRASIQNPLSDGSRITATDWTSTDAMRHLARALTRWAEGRRA